jgi:hypothetical protein
MINDGGNGQEITRPRPSTTLSATSSLRREARPLGHDRYAHLSPAYLSTQEKQTYKGFHNFVRRTEKAAVNGTCTKQVCQALNGSLPSSPAQGRRVV